MRPDGITSAQDIAEKSLPEHMLPFVVAGTRLTPLESNTQIVTHVVSNDDFLGANLATEPRMVLGHKHIAHINVHSGAGQKRLASYIASMNGHGLVPLANETPGPATEHYGYTQALLL